MTARRKYLWGRMTWKEIERAAAERPQPVVLFPFGAVEQHGQQTPVGTDIVLAQHLSDRVAEETGALSLPGIPFGYSPQFDGFHGTISLSPETVTAIVSEVCGHVLRHGFDHMVIINNHAGNAPMVEAACRKFRDTQGVLIASLFPYALCKEFQDDQYPVREGLFGHGAEPVVSLASALVPDDMRMDLAVPDRWSTEQLWESLGGPKMKLYASSVKLFFGLREASATGTLGDPRQADGRRGRVMIDRAIKYAVEFVRAFQRVNTRTPQASRGAEAAGA